MTDLGHTILLSVGGTAAIAKFSLMAARTMPPPPEHCKFFCRWAYDFIQAACENSDKVGKSQAPGKPVGVEQPTVTLSKQTAEVAQP